MLIMVEDRSSLHYFLHFYICLKISITKCLRIVENLKEFNGKTSDINHKII